MSVDATYWAWQQKLRATHKLVLLSLADRANEQHRCYPGIARLSSDTCLNRKTVIDAIKHLEQCGLIVCDKSRRNTIYSLVGVADRYTKNNNYNESIGTKNGTSQTSIGTENGTDDANTTSTISTKNGTNGESIGTKNGTSQTSIGTKNGTDDANTTSTISTKNGTNGESIGTKNGTNQNSIGTKNGTLLVPKTVPEPIITLRSDHIRSSGDENLNKPNPIPIRNIFNKFFKSHSHHSQILGPKITPAIFRWLEAKIPLSVIEQAIEYALARRPDCSPAYVVPVVEQFWLAYQEKPSAVVNPADAKVVRPSQGARRGEGGLREGIVPWTALGLSKSEYDNFQKIWQKHQKSKGLGPLERQEYLRRFKNGEFDAELGVTRSSGGMSSIENLTKKFNQSGD